MRPALLASLAAAVVVVSRSEIAVRALRLLDQRSGLFAPRGARLYAVLAPRILGRFYPRVADVAVRVLGSHPAPTIVDLGSGPGVFALELARRLPKAQVIGVEPAAVMRAAAIHAATLAGVTATFVPGEAEDLPLADASVDLVVSTLSLHHWRDPSAALREITRVLGPHGRALIVDARFVTYGDGDLRRHVERAGIEGWTVTREVLPWGLVRPYALVTVGRNR